MHIFRMRNFRNYGDIIGTIDRFCSGGGGDQEGAEKSRGCEEAAAGV
jgi:hypothetical protein